MVSGPSLHYNLAVLRPKIAKEWHPDKNGPLTPRWVTPGSHKKVWWLGKCGHAWQTTICHRGQRIVPGRRKPSGCPYCAATNKRPSREFNLMVKYPTLASQWHPTKNKRDVQKLYPLIKPVKQSGFGLRIGIKISEAVGILE